MKKKKAVFLDRDGTINKEVDNLRSVKQLRLLPGVADAIKKINKLGFLVVVVSNQPVVARGWITEADVDAIHKELARRLAVRGACIDAFYFCPHHPNANLRTYRKHCSCRKPNIGLLKKAARDFKINLRKSFFVGDRTADILAGRRAGAKTILVKTGYGGGDGQHEVEPDYMVRNLIEAAKVIKRISKS